MRFRATAPSFSRKPPGRRAGSLFLVALLALCMASAHGVAAQEASDAPRLVFDGVELAIGGRVQTQLATTSVEGQPSSRLFFRRVRLEVAVEVSDRIGGVIQPDFAGDRVSLADAYLLMTFSPGLEVLAGRAYRPFGLLEQTSSKRILPVERGLRIRGVGDADQYAFASGLGYSGRDLGIQLRGTPNGAPLGLSYAVGVFRGPLHETLPDRNSYQLAARVTARPAEAFRIGAGWSGRDFVGGGGSAPETRLGHAFELDLEYGGFDPGWHLLAELSAGEVDAFADVAFRGAHAWLAYRTEPTEGTGPAFEPLLRLSVSDATGADAPAVGPSGGTLLTPGLNLYFDPLNRIMLNVDVWRGDDALDAESVKLMFQLAF